MSTDPQDGYPIPPDYDFGVIAGIGGKLNTAIHANFQTWESIADTPLRELLNIKGLSKAAARQLRMCAEEQVTLRNEARLRESVPERVKRAIAHDGEGTPTETKFFIISRRRADDFNEVCRRVLMSDAVCSICGWDLIALNGLAPWDELTKAKQEDLRVAMAMHKQAKHSGADCKQIITKEEMDELGFPRRNEVYVGGKANVEPGIEQVAKKIDEATGSVPAEIAQ